MKPTEISDDEISERNLGLIKRYKNTRDFYRRTDELRRSRTNPPQPVPRNYNNRNDAIVSINLTKN
jgi:hypothetical protein